MAFLSWKLELFNFLCFSAIKITSRPRILTASLKARC
jgi:hypothetical protein